MTADKQKRLDDVADRLGAIYQMVGRLQHKHAIDDDLVTAILNGVLSITEEVELISDRVNRAADEAQREGVRPWQKQKARHDRG